MKKRFAVLTLALLLSLAIVGGVGVGVAGATHSNGEGPDYDFVRGTWESATGAKFHVNAKSGPSGEDPKGRFYVEFKEAAEATPPRIPFDFRGEVTCLNVDGNTARVGGRVTHAKGDLPGNPAEGGGFLITVVDNGEPGDNDHAVGLPSPQGVPDVCPLRTTANPGQHGNFVVHDATP